MRILKNKINNQKFKNYNSLWWLFLRAWNILYVESRGKERISRGEFFVSVLLLLLIIDTIIFLYHVLNIPAHMTMRLFHRDGIYILNAILFIYCWVLFFWLCVKRTRDLWKPTKYITLPVYVMLSTWLIYVIVSLIFFVANLLTDGWEIAATIAPFGFSINLLQWILLWLLVWFVIVLWNLIFKKWTKWDNDYGNNPLLNQPLDNNRYRYVWSIWILIWIFTIYVILL